MKAIVRKDNGKAYYLFADGTPIALNSDGMLFGGRKSLDINSTDHEVITIDAPTEWVGGGAMSIQAGVWQVDDQAAYDDELARRAEEAADRAAEQAARNNVNFITKLECKFQAQAEGLWGNLKAALNAPGSEDIKENWDMTTGLDITRPDVQAMGLAMGKDAAALQTFFNNAKGRKA